MIQTIISVIVLLLALATPKVYALYCEEEYNETKAKEMKEKFKKAPIMGAAAIIIAVLMGTATIRVVPTGEVGVKTVFGVVSGRANEGLNMIAPWEDIVSMNTKIQKQSFTNLSASTKDAQSISNINIDVNYELNPDKAEEIYANVGLDYQNTIISPLLTQFIKDRLALYNAESLVSERNKIVDDITAQLQEHLKDYGVDVVAVSLVNYDFSADFNSALEKKAVAAKEIETAKNNQEKAKIEAETNRIKTMKEQIAGMVDNVVDEKIGEYLKTHAKRVKDDLLVELVRNALNLNGKGKNND